MWPRLLKAALVFVPKGDDLVEVMKLYKEKRGFAVCAGAIDGTHVPIFKPL